MTEDRLRGREGGRAAVGGVLTGVEYCEEISETRLRDSSEFPLAYGRPGRGVAGVIGMPFGGVGARSIRTKLGGGCGCICGVLLIA